MNPPAPEPMPLGRGEMLELTSARGIAALAVVLYHVDAYCGGVIYRALPTPYFGPLAVDFFFVLSGFVMAHVYGRSWAEGRYSHAGFLVRRFARIWPLHMACLLLVAAIVLGGAKAGLAPQWEPTWSSFLAHAAMLHATGLSPEKAWNQPSWSVSAEWTAYLAFPLYLMLANLFRSPIAKLAAAAGLLAALWLCLKALFGLDFFTLTTFGALRIIPLFFAGIVLRQIMGLGYGRALDVSALNRLLLAAVAALYLGMAFQAPFAAMWVLLLALLYLLALRSQRDAGDVMRSAPMVWSGAISYALYLVHGPVLMVVYGLGSKLAGVSSDLGKLALGGVAIVIAVTGAAIAHHLIEVPAQRLILRIGHQAKRPQPAAEPAA
ncbi:acyltransferase family protein [Hansschlegelia plantiphila]|uniref:Acyltransferase n=1 Tax=Hansschlegelia plantiphila TaxID=374655 RepID=A0A9W6J140_9HYPH|nr:acyltransferase [Hansschlegelia plantiphila]GLK67459.1 acyltransferase [Hansschlegelia plantiphila]